MFTGFSRPFRRALWRAHGGCCAYCGDLLRPDHFHVDHVTPRQRGGTDAVANLAAACERCNTCKRDRTLEEFRWLLAVSNSPVGGIILAKQAAQLRELGVQLPVGPYRFHFEERAA